MGSILHTTLNTRALPTGDLRYIRSDYPGKLTDDEVKWLRKNDITTIVDIREEKEYETRPCRLETKDNLMEFLTSYASEHPEVDINIILPNEDNIRNVLEVLQKE